LAIGEQLLQINRTPTCLARLASWSSVRRRSVLQRPDV